MIVIREAMHRSLSFHRQVSGLKSAKVHSQHNFILCRLPWSTIHNSREWFVCQSQHFRLWTCPELHIQCDCTWWWYSISFWSSPSRDHCQRCEWQLTWVPPQWPVLHKCKWRRLCQQFYCYSLCESVYRLYIVANHLVYNYLITGECHWYGLRGFWQCILWSISSKHALFSHHAGKWRGRSPSGGFTRQRNSGQIHNHNFGQRWR